MKPTSAPPAPHRRHIALGALLAVGLLVCAPITAAALSEQAPAAPVAEARYSVWGGELRLLPEPGLWRDLGISLLRTEPASEPARPTLRLANSSALEFSAPHASLQAFDGGRLLAEGSLLLQGPEGELRLTAPQLRPPADGSLTLQLTDAEGAVWFTLHHMHFKFNPLAEDFRLWNVDLRLGTDLAQRLGLPQQAGRHLGQVELLTHFQQTSALAADPAFCLPIRWPGTPVNPADPLSPPARADVLLIDLSGFTVNRCNTANQSCDGPGGVDAEMVISPSAELRNSNDPDTAAVPWFEKFSGNFAPYGNDQHPFLIWNIYRTEADGRLVQIARSGVKHAFLTVNSACQSCPLTHPQNNFHILWPNCRDTYGTANNDTTRHLGPRREIAPHSVRWGRCGSVYDQDCNGVNDFPAQTQFDHRTRVRESAFDSALHGGASYRFEGWYLVREDVNIWNTMGSRSFVPSYSSGWQLGNPGPFSQGPAIDHWVDPGSTSPHERNRLLATSEGQLKAAVRVSEIEPGRWLYHYAFANFDLAREVTQGTEPNLRLLGNRGLSSVRLGLPGAAQLEAVRFHDGDDDGANDWSHSRAGEQLRFEATAGNTLDWGSLYTFSFESDHRPLVGPIELIMAELGDPAGYSLSLPVPALGPDDLFRDGAEGEP